MLHALIALLVGLLVLDRIPAWIERLWPRREPVVERPDPAPVIEQAVRDSFAACGLNPADCAPGFDVARTGKLNDVLHHASATIGLSHPIRTVQDIHDLLRKGLG